MDRDEALAELERRGLTPTISKQTISKQEALNELMRRRKIATTENARNTNQFQPSDYVSVGPAIKSAVSRAIPNVVQGGVSLLRGIGDLPITPWGQIQAAQSDKYGDYLRAGMGGLAKGTGALLNIPHNLVEYWREDATRRGEPIPDWVRGWKPSEDTTQFIKDAENYWTSKIKNPEAPSTELLGGIAHQVPATVATGNPLAALAATAIGENRNPIEDPLAAIVGGKIINTAAEYGPKVVGKASDIVKHGIEDINKGKYSQAKTVERGNQIVSDLENYYKEGYETITTDPRLPPIELNIPDQAIARFKKANPKLTAEIDRTLASRNPTDVHHLASKVGKYLDKQQSSPFPNDTGVYYGYKLKEALENGLDNSLKTVPELQSSYRSLDKQFASDLGRVGHKVRSKLKKYRAKKVGPESVMRAFRLPEGAEEFRYKFGPELPGIKGAKYPETWKNLPGTRHIANLLRKTIGDNK